MAVMESKTDQEYSYENPECKPVEDLKIKKTKNGLTDLIPALNACWCEPRLFTLYIPPPEPDESGAFPLGAKEDWLERIGFLVEDMEWLLQLPYFKFWSQVAFGDGTLNGMMSFLQHALPYYQLNKLPTDSEVQDAYHTVHHLVFLVISRISVSRESETEWMREKTLGNILYDNYLITVPILFDMCVVYGKDNQHEVSQIVHKIFRVQPLYEDDLNKSIDFMPKVLNLIENQMNSKNISEAESPVKLTDRAAQKSTPVTKALLAYIIPYLLDTSVNISTFLDVYPPAAVLYHNKGFEKRVASFYENTIPVLCHQLEIFYNKEETICDYCELKTKLDLARVQLLQIFHHILFYYINNIIMNRQHFSEEEIKKNVDEYSSALCDCLSHRLFITDYHSGYPVDQDLDIICQVYPEMDSVKCDYILESVLSCFDVKPKKQVDRGYGNNYGESLRNIQDPMNAEPGPSGLNTKKRVVTGVDLESLITEVKDIFPHLGDGFVQKCLEFYNYESAEVINSLLENSLPDHLVAMDKDLPFIPPEEEDGAKGTDIPERVNVFDNDEFDIMTKDHIDTSRIHKGKRRGKHKNLTDMLDDKSHVHQLRDMYSKLGLVETEETLEYDDEYDDTYDDPEVSIQETETETERRPFVTPRVLQPKAAPELEEDDAEEDGNMANGNDEREHPRFDYFVPNPEEIRAKAEERRMNFRSRTFRGTGQSRDVVGKPKGQGQERDVVHNRDYKQVHKSTRGNHNRRIMAAKKRQQGMMPS